MEGYLESAATGIAAAAAVDRLLRKKPPLAFPRRTVIGSLAHYLANADARGFAPINAMIGILPEPPEDALDVAALKKSGGAKGLKAAKRGALRDVALAEMRRFMDDALCGRHGI
uniref:tRNA:m(5)U-54 MTase gid n=1 Tax=uncultured bacterium contig00097 TaxID=1181566 RepID=A0A806KRG4_9BACT|nr:tRNA:m(5)U-54 MTase gid [uncultured bacterium contig00097]